METNERFHRTTPGVDWVAFGGLAATCIGLRELSVCPVCIALACFVYGGCSAGTTYQN